MTAFDDFTGADVRVECTIIKRKAQHEGAKGNQETVTETTGPLNLGHKDKPTFFEKYKDIVGPVSANIVTGVFGLVTGVFGFLAGRKKTK